MTPFMRRVAALLHGEAGPTPERIPSRLRPMGQALHNQVELRAMAEQLVSEANVLLDAHGAHLDLVDETSPTQLSFSVFCGAARAVVTTAVSGRQAWGRLEWNGGDGETRELNGVEALADLLLDVMATSRTTGAV